MSHAHSSLCRSDAVNHFCFTEGSFLASRTWIFSSFLLILLLPLLVFLAVLFFSFGLPDSSGAVLSCILPAYLPYGNYLAAGSQTSQWGAGIGDCFFTTLSLMLDSEFMGKAYP